MLLQGIFVPLLTPFYRDGRPYWRKLEANTGRYGLTPVAGLLALAPGSDASSFLTDVECAEALKIVADTAPPSKVLLAGIERSSVFAALELAGHAAVAGFDAIVVRAPRLRESGMLARELFLRAVADQSPLPVVLWSDNADGGLPVEVVASLASHPRVLGMIDAGLTPQRLAEIREVTAGISHEVTVTTVFEAVTGRMLRVAEPAPTLGAAGFVSAESLTGGTTAVAVPPPPVVVASTLKTRTRTVGFQLMAAGDAAPMATLMEQGVPAFAPRLAICAPQAVYEAYAAMKDGDPALSQVKAGRLTGPDELMRELGDPGLRYAADWNAYYGGSPRLPLVSLSAEDRSRVEAAFREIRN